MSNKAVGIVLDAIFPESLTYEGGRVLGSTAKFVLVILADACNEKGLGACQSLRTVEARTGLSRPTVSAAMKALAEAGLIVRRGVSHIYHTNNYDLNLVALVGMAAHAQQIDEDDAGVVKPVYQGGKVGGKTGGKATLPYPLTVNVNQEEEEAVSAPDLPVEEPEPEKAPEPATRPNVFAVYEQNIGPLTPMVANTLGEAVDEHGEKWVEAAIREATHAGARNWRYIQAILARWKREGYGSKSPQKAKADQGQQKQRRKGGGGDGRIRSQEDFEREMAMFLADEEVVDVQKV